MAKRQASNELNHDNWDVEEEKEEPGTFQTVSPVELQTRVIKKAKRSIGSNSSPSSSPFAVFSGFSSANSKFSFLSGNKQISGQRTQSIEGKKSEEKQNGNTETSQEKTDKKNDSTISKGRSSRSIEYYRQLQSLNESVFKWMQLHLSKNPCCDFTPVFNDYKKHLDTLNVTYPVEKKQVVSSTVKFDNFNFKKPATSEDYGSTPKDVNSSTSSKDESAAKKDGEETDYGAHFASNTTNTQTFSFGIKLTPTSTSSGSPFGPTSSTKDSEKEKNHVQFSFKRDPTTESSKNSTFSFAVAPAEKQNETSEDVEYVPPKNSFTPVSEEDAIYSVRCKLFYKKGDNYTDKGVGTLHLKKLDGKTQLLIRADTSLGNILLNIILSASLPISRTGRNNVLLVCIPNPPLDVKDAESKEAIPILIRVKTSEDADNLLEELNKHKS